MPSSGRASAWLCALALGAAAVPATAQDKAPTPSPAPAAPGETRFGAERLQRLPAASDPWSLLRRVPGVLVDRVDVGGSGLAQQALVVSRGDAGPGTTFTLDGFDVTDPAALGFSTLFLDLSLADSVSVRTAGGDSRARGAGAAFAVTLPDPLEAWDGGLKLRGSERLLEWSAAAGGPLLRERLTFWGAASRQELRQATASGRDETFEVTSFLARAGLRLGRGRTTLLAVRSEKIHEDRDPTGSASAEALWRQSGPTAFLGLTDHRPVRGLEVTTRLLWLESGFELTPRGGGDVTAFEDLHGIFQRSYQAFETDRPRREATLEAAGRLRVLGREHRLSGGASYSRSAIETRSQWPGTGAVGFERGSVFFETFRLTGFAQLTRAQDTRTVQDRAALWVADSLPLGRFTLDLGARLERQAGHNAASIVPASPLRPDLLPGVAFGGAEPRFRWLDLLPRASLAWDVDGGGRVAVRAGYAALGAFLGPGEVGFDNPLAQPASLTWFWTDRNGDRRVDPDELELDRPLQGAAAVDPADPGAASSPNLVDPDLAPPRTHELRLSAEFHPSPRWEAGVGATWRRLTSALWRPLRGLAASDYAPAGGASGALFGRPYDVVAYAPAVEVDPRTGRVLTNRLGYAQDYVGLDLSAARRFGEQGTLTAFVTLKDWSERFRDRERAVQDPTPRDIEPLQNGGALFGRPGGPGRGDVFVNSRWSAGLEARALLPGALDACMTLWLRDGFPVPYFATALTDDPTGSAKDLLVAAHLDSYRMPTLALVDLRLARSFRAGPGTLTPALEIGNLLNRATTLQVRRDAELPRVGTPHEVLRPRSFIFAAYWRF